ncbi:MAG TPA: glycosyl hydrolase family 28 protein [Rhodocyclaceae bacterium]|nr:glycosyl hydrolase family 28 protein [Rhodocyclaceae bacterium]
MFRKSLIGAALAMTASGAFAATDAPTGYTKCAQPAATCTMSGTHQAAMGKAGVFAYATLTGSFLCDASVFPGAPNPSAWCSYDPTAAGSSSSAASSVASSAASSAAASSTASSAASSAASSTSGSLLPPQNAVVPPLAFEDTHITVTWEKPSSYSTVTGYRIYVNGTLKGTVSNISWPAGITNQQLYYDITGLTANTAYSINVRAIDAAGAESANSNTVSQTTMATPTVINVTASPYSAVGNGTTLNTVAIQKAINACPVGGKVLIPSGTFKSGALYLKSDCTYQIDGVLLGSDTAADYEWGSNRFPIYGTSGFGTATYPTNYKALLNTCGYYTDWTARTGYVADNLCVGMKNIRIVGAGTVQGSSGSSADSANSGYYLSTLAHNQRAAQGGDNATGDTARADLVNLTGVNGLYIANLKFSLPAMHMLYLARSSNITVANINANSWPSASSKGIHNGDGVDLSTAYATALTASGPTGLLPTNAYIFGSTFDNGDDCINLNAGTSAPGVTAATPVNGVKIFNNYTLHGHGGVVLGSFTAAGFKNIAITENTFNGTEIGLRFKTGVNRGGGIAPLSGSDFGVKAIDNKVNAIIDDAIIIMASYPDSTFADAPSPGYFHDITVTNLSGSVGSSGYAMETTGNSGSEHTNIKMTNVNITGGKGYSIYGLKGASSVTMFTTLKSSAGTFYYDGSLLSASNFASCSPAPTAK